MEQRGSRRDLLRQAFLLTFAGAALAGPGWTAPAAKPAPLKDLLGKPVSAYVKAYGEFKKTSEDGGITLWEFKPPRQTVLLVKSPKGMRVFVTFSQKGIEADEALRQVGFDRKGVMLRPDGEIRDALTSKQFGSIFKVDGLAKLPVGFEDVQWNKMMNDEPSSLVFGPKNPS